MPWKEPVEINMFQGFQTKTLLFDLIVTSKGRTCVGYPMSVFWKDTSAKKTHLTKNFQRLANELSNVSSDFKFYIRERLC